MNDPHAAPELEEEQEVDLASAWQRLKLRWWLPVGGLLLGAVVGLVLALAGGSVWRAETIVYLGQPFAPARRRPDPEPRDESPHRRRDRPLGVGDPAGVQGERHPRVAAPCVDLDP
jgi:hypothetical protein